MKLLLIKITRLKFFSDSFLSVIMSVLINSFKHIWKYLIKIMIKAAILAILFRIRKVQCYQYFPEDSLHASTFIGLVVWDRVCRFFYERNDKTLPTWCIATDSKVWLLYFTKNKETKNCIKKKS